MDGWAMEALSCMTFMKMGKQYSALACREDETSNDRTMELDRQKLEKPFATWLDGPIAKGMIDVSPLHHFTAHD